MVLHNREQRDSLNDDGMLSDDAYSNHQQVDEAEWASGIESRDEGSSR